MGGEDGSSKTMGEVCLGKLLAFDYAQTRVQGDWYHEPRGVGYDLGGRGYNISRVEMKLGSRRRGRG